MLPHTGISGAARPAPLTVQIHVRSTARDVDPDAPMVRRRKASDGAPGGRIEHAGEPEQRTRPQRPEHAFVDELERLPREDVVGAEVAGRGVGEVRSVETRIASVERIRSSLERCCLDGTRAVGSRLRVDERVLEQLLNRARDAVAVERIGVLVTCDDEQLARLQTPVCADVVVDVARPSWADVVGPEPDLVEVSAAVAILRSVEDRRRRM